MNTLQLISIFCQVDDFVKEFNIWQKNWQLPEPKFAKSSAKTRNRPTKMNLSEMLTVMICFSLSPCKEFKMYYLYTIRQQFAGYFAPCSYNRFVELMPRLFVPLSVLLYILRGKKTGIYYVDSTKMEVCHNKREKSHKLFKDLAAKGMSSYGWFYGFKLHLVINDKGQIMAVKITRGNVDDRKPLQNLCKDLKGKIFGDKGYIGKKHFQKLYRQGLMLMTSIRSNMKNCLLSFKDKLLLRRRTLVESVFNTLKNKLNLVHTRHRSVNNFCVHVLACLCGYCLKYHKKKTKCQSKDL